MEQIKDMEKEKMQIWEDLMQALNLKLKDNALLTLANMLAEFDHVNALAECDIDGLNAYDLSIKVIQSKQTDSNKTYTVIFRISDKQALVKLNAEITEMDWDSHVEDLRDFEILLPLEKRKLDGYGHYLKTYNLKNKKLGLFDPDKKEFKLPEKYDSIEFENLGWLLVADGKSSFMGYDKTYDIPNIYDSIQEMELSGNIDPNNRMVLTSQDNHLGAYFYMLDFDYKYDVTYDRTLKTPYIKSKCVAPLFDGLEIAKIDNENKTYILKVTLNGKVGLLDVFKERFIAPIIFDEITSFSYNQDGTVTIYGIIDDVPCLYDGNNLYQLVQMTPTYSEEFKRTREIIEKK